MPRPATRFVFERNPYYHRVDATGQQLPYIDRVILDVAAGGLMAAKANAGETDLLSRGLSMSDIPILKEGEHAKGYRTLLWLYARGSELALYPNLNTADPVWRTLNRDVRFRRALSLGIDRRTLNNALLFGLGREGNNTIMEESALFSPELRSTYAEYDPAEASRLLDEIGLTKRNGAGIRLLPDGRELEIIVETDGEGGLIVDGLTLITEFWREIGVKLFVKPQDRTILRNRAYAGLTVMVAAQGLDLAVPTAKMAPTELAPMMPDLLRLAEMGPVRRDQGQERRGLRHPRGEAPARALRALDGDRRRSRPRAGLARDARRTTPRTSGRSARSPARSSRSSPGTGSSTYRRRRSTAGSRARCSGSTGSTSSTGTRRPARRLRSRLRAGEANDPLPPAACPDDGGDAGDHLGARVLHHQAAARRLPHQPDRRAARAGRGGVGREGRVPDPAVRARSAGVGAVSRLDRRLAESGGRLQRPHRGRLGLVLRIRQAGQRGRRRRALADAAGQLRGRHLRPYRGDPDRHLLGDAAILARRLRRDLRRLYRACDAELPPGADPALLFEPLVRHFDRRALRPAPIPASRGAGARCSRSPRTSSFRPS